jgi:hypothetical protein
MPNARVPLVQKCAIRAGDRRRGSTGARHSFRNDDAGGLGQDGGGQDGLGGLEGQVGRARREGQSQWLDHKFVSESTDLSELLLRTSAFLLLTSYLLLLLLFLLWGAFDRSHFGRRCRCFLQVLLSLIV